MWKFTNYVSLGNACKTRHQIDRIFKSRFETYQPAKGYFDWLWGGGMDGVIQAIKNNFEITDKSLIVKKAGGTIQVCDVSTGFYFLHDFKFSKEALADLEIANNEMLDHLVEFRNKYAVMADKTRTLFRAAEGICFVYAGRISRQQAKDFFASTLTLFQTKPMLLNIVPFDEVPDYAEISGFGESWQVRVVNDDPVKGTPMAWKGCDDSWDHALQDFSYC